MGQESHHLEAAVTKLQTYRKASSLGSSAFGGAIQIVQDSVISNGLGTIDDKSRTLRSVHWQRGLCHG